MADLYNLFAEVENASAVFGIKEGHVRDVPLLDDDEESDGDDDFVADEASATCSSDSESGVSAASSSSGTESDASGESTGHDGASESSNASRADAAAPVEMPRLRPRLPTAARLQQQAQEGLRARLRHILRNLEQLRAHKIRTVMFSQLRKDQLRDLDHYTVMEWKDYMGKLEARKSQQGTSENQGFVHHGQLLLEHRPMQGLLRLAPQGPFNGQVPLQASHLKTTHTRDGCARDGVAPHLMNALCLAFALRHFLQQALVRDQGSPTNLLLELHPRGLLLGHQGHARLHVQLQLRPERLRNTMVCNSTIRRSIHNQRLKLF